MYYELEVYIYMYYELEVYIYMYYELEVYIYICIMYYYREEHNVDTIGPDNNVLNIDVSSFQDLYTNVGQMKVSCL